MRRFFVISYLIVLAMSVGAILVLGVITAPVVFGSDALITETISRYSQGVIMTEIFSRANYWLIFLFSFVFLYEAYDFKMFRRDKIVLISAVVVGFTSVMFVFYYSPDIIAMQLAHQTQTEVFENVHKASELDYKMLLVGLLVLLIRRFTQLVRK